VAALLRRRPLRIDRLGREQRLDQAPDERARDGDGIPVEGLCHVHADWAGRPVVDPVVPDRVVVEPERFGQLPNDSEARRQGDQPGASAGRSTWRRKAKGEKVGAHDLIVLCEAAGIHDWRMARKVGTGQHGGTEF